MINSEVLRLHENHIDTWKLVKTDYNLRESDRADAVMEICDHCEFLTPIQFVQITEELRFFCGFCLGNL
jgi:hypothetical protein